MQSVMPPAATIPRPTAFSAVIAVLIGLNAIFFAIGLINFGYSEQMYLDSFAWIPYYGLIDAALAITMYSLLWLRQKWAFFVICAQCAFGLVVGLSLPAAPKVLLFVGPVLLALLFWSLHVGGMASMWRQLFGAPQFPGAGRGFPGMQPAMPPGMAPSMPAGMPPNVAPGPPPRAGEPSATGRPTSPGTSAGPGGGDVYDQLKKLAALRDAGVLTPNEFDAKKAELLKRL